MVPDVLTKEGTTMPTPSKGGKPAAKPTKK